METAVTIGLDLGRSVFQVHGVDAGGAVVFVCGRSWRRWETNDRFSNRPFGVEQTFRTVPPGLYDGWRTDMIAGAPNER